MIVHRFNLDLDWRLVTKLSAIDRFDASWSGIEVKEGRTLVELKSIATLRSVGASTRIEGSQMSDVEVEILLEHLEITKLSDRDSQEVAGYFDVLDLISQSHSHIGITENSLRDLHNRLLKYGDKDAWHRGRYKQHANSVVASAIDGTKYTVFETTAPGFETENSLRDLINWYHQEKEVHVLVKCALFCYEFVSIHPFQDGNGRLSRLLATLLLLKANYKWIQYVSFEHEIESRKGDYYRILRECQSQRPFENISSWIYFFFDCLVSIQEQLMVKLSKSGIGKQLSSREKSILVLISEKPGMRSGDISLKLGIALSTTKRILRKLIDLQLIEKFESGPATNYSIR